MTTAGFIVFMLLLLAAFIVGAYIGSFNTKRKAEFVGKIMDWKTEVEDKYKKLKQKV